MIFLAKDVALSVTISSVSTLVGVVATPLLTVCTSTRIFRSTSWACCSAFCRLWSFLSRWDDCPSSAAEGGESGRAVPARLSMVCILAIISAVVAGSAAHRLRRPGGDYRGDPAYYWSAWRVLGRTSVWFDESTCRTLAIEVGCRTRPAAALVNLLRPAGAAGRAVLRLA